MGVEHDRRVQDRQREERVLRHLEEHVHRPDRVAHPPRARVQADRRPPEEQPDGQVQGVLEIVDRRVLEATRRRSARSGSTTSSPRRGPRSTTGKVTTRITREWRIGRITRCRTCGVDTRRRRVIGAPERRSAAPRRGSAAGAGPCGPRRGSCRSVSMPDIRANAIDAEPGEEADRPPARDRVGGVGPVHLPDEADPDDGRRDEREEDGRLDRPAEEEVRRRRRLGRDRAVGAGDAGRGERGEAAERHRPADDAAHGGEGRAWPSPSSSHATALVAAEPGGRRRSGDGAAGHHDGGGPARWAGKRPPPADVRSPPAPMLDPGSARRLAFEDRRCRPPQAAGRRR